MQYRFLIYFSYSYALPIGKPLEQEILRLGHEVRWFADEVEGKESIKNNPLNLPTVKSMLAYAPHILLSITDNCPDFLDCLRVQIFHGFNAEKRSPKRDHFNIRGFYDLYCTQGPSTTSLFKELSKEKKHFEVVETGWSKVDPLFLLTESAPNKVPHIFLSSTFSTRLSMALNNSVFKKIKELSITGNYIFEMVLHPKLDDQTIAQWKSLESEFFIYHDTTQFTDIMKRADLMFCDTTSVLQEFGLLEKPIVTFNHRAPKSHHINITDSSEIESAINHGLTKPAILIDELKKFNAQLHPYKDGKSSSRVIQACIAQVHKPKTHLKNKPLNIIRKFKIRSLLNFLTLKSFNKPFVLPDSTNRQPITAILPVGNEIHNINDVINSVSFADEILVVDSMSTDGTFEIASSKNVKIIRRPYGYSSSQKNFAIPQAKHDWIILVDADERVTPRLKDEILLKMCDPSKGGHVAYWIRRSNHFMGKAVRFSGMRNDKVIRLFMRDKCRYEDKMVHAEIIADGKVGKLKNKFYHNTYIDIDTYVKKLNRYATWQARDYHKTTGRLTAFHFVVKPAYGFFKHYFIQLGFLDGVVGFVLAYLRSYGIIMRYVKLWLYRRGLE